MINWMFLPQIVLWHPAACAARICWGHRDLLVGRNDMDPKNFLANDLSESHQASDLKRSFYTELFYIKVCNIRVNQAHNTHNTQYVHMPIQSNRLFLWLHFAPLSRDVSECRKHFLRISPAKKRLLCEQHSWPGDFQARLHFPESASPFRKVLVPRLTQEKHLGFFAVSPSLSWLKGWAPANSPLALSRDIKMERRLRFKVKCIWSSDILFGVPFCRG